MDAVIREKHPDALSMINTGISATPYFEATIKELDELDKSDATTIHLVDIGAGSLVDPRAVVFLSLSKYPIICVRPPRLESFQRAQKHRPAWKNASFSQFLSVEYSENREKIYSSAHRDIDSSKPEVDCVNELLKAIEHFKIQREMGNKEDKPTQ